MRPFHEDLPLCRNCLKPKSLPRQLRVHLLGAELNDCLVGRADIVREGLPTLSWYYGAALEAVERYGKERRTGV